MDKTNWGKPQPKPQPMPTEPVIYPSSEGTSIFWCPACSCAHMIQSIPGKRPHWELSGPPEFPSVKPSIKVTSSPRNGKDHVCHFWIKNGWIEYAGDSTHEMAGKRVQMTPIPDSYDRR